MRLPALPGRAHRRDAFTAALLALCLGLAGCGSPEHTAHDDHGHDAHGGHGDHAAEHAPRGPHGGRLFEADGVHLELSIFETDVPPEFRAYLSDEQGRALPTEGVTLWVTLDRFAGRRDSLAFRAEPGFLRSTSEVSEPHSFAASIHLERGGVRHTWSYEQEEGRVRLSPEAVREGDIGVAVAGARDIEVQLEAPGEIRLNADHVVQVRPRFAGVVSRVLRSLGEEVSAGDVLAVVHSNESLADYEVTAPMAGTLVARDAAAGQAVDRDRVLFTVADLGTVWAYFPLYPQYASRMRTGQVVRVRSQGDQPVEATSRLSYVGPLLEQDTRISYGRAELGNGSRRWTPGLFVTVAVTVDRVPARVAVPEDAIVRTSRGPAVFRAEGSTFELQPVETGATDGAWTEITRGLRTGDSIVVRNAFLLKAELGKSEATHDH